MAKVIAFFADGTWNGIDVDKDDDGVPEETNVLKLYRHLAGTDTPESAGLEKERERVLEDADGNVAQIAKYLHGVGDSGNAIKKVVGGAFGSGLISRIVRGYTFISRNYRPGDRIVIAGFSRGAYTARALGGMIAKAGLIDYRQFDNMRKDEAYECGLYVWAYYREQQQKNIAKRAVAKLWSSVLGRGAEIGREHMIPDVPIEAIGVWDTVGALGVPLYGQQDERVDLFRFADTDLSEKVKRGFHALAIDENRSDFSPTPWASRDGVEQVWFIGAHADVGGGYEESDLSNHALAWMGNRLALNGQGLIYQDPPPASVAGRFDAGIHDSWDRLPYKLKPRFHRPIGQMASLHQSVSQRRGVGGLAYAPSGLVNWAGQYVD